MRWSDIQFDPPRKVLRQFAGLCLLIFGGLALWEVLGRGRIVLGGWSCAPRHDNRPARIELGPSGFDSIYVGWMVLAFPIGWTISQIMLLAMFFGLFTPIGLVFRLLGRDPLHRARRPGPRIILGSQAGTGRPAALFQTVLTTGLQPAKSNLSSGS